MTITAKEARIRINKTREEREKFDFKYPTYTKAIDAKIEEAVAELECRCYIELINRHDSFFKDLKEYYESFGYQVKISDVKDGFFKVDKPQGCYREIVFSW